MRYLNDKVEVKTVINSYSAFRKYLDDDNTDVFFGKLGEKYATEYSNLKTYDGFATGGVPSYGHGSHKGAAARGTDRGENLDPKPRLPAGTGASGNSGSSSSSLSANKVPDPSE